MTSKNDISKELSRELYIQRARKFRAKKRLGQNFLVSPEVLDKIISNAVGDDIILEIGPGLGFVTEKLVKRASKVVAVELDEDMIKVLEKNLSSAENFTLIHNDILKTNLKDIFKEEFEEGKKIKVIANIPYYITSPIIAHLVGEIDDVCNENRGLIEEIILMVQYEVAKRLVATSNSPGKEYGMLSVLAQFWADVGIIKNVSKKCFFPSPKVDSALLRIKINDKPRCEITPYLKRTIKAGFLQRRKNIKNSLINAGFKNVEEALFKAGFSPQIRAEKLSIEDFCKLSKTLYECDFPLSKRKVAPVNIEAGLVPDFDKINELKDWIFENVSLVGMTEILSNKRMVMFSKSNVNRSLKDAGRKEVRRNSYAKLKGILENSIYCYTKNADEKHSDRVKGQEIYYSALVYKNRIFGVEISIDVPKAENIPYAYAGHKIKIMKTVPGISEVSSKEGLLDSTGTANISITDIMQLFNPKGQIGEYSKELCDGKD